MVEIESRMSRTSSSRPSSMSLRATPRAANGEARATRSSASGSGDWRRRGPPSRSWPGAGWASTRTPAGTGIVAAPEPQAHGPAPGHRLRNGSRPCRVARPASQGKPMRAAETARSVRRRAPGGTVRPAFGASSAFAARRRKPPLRRSCRSLHRLRPRLGPGDALQQRLRPHGRGSERDRHRRPPHPDRGESDPGPDGEGGGGLPLHVCRFLPT